MPSRRTRARISSLILSPVALLALAAGAAGQDEAPRRPPEPFRVFVHASDPADAALKARLEEAVPTVRERIKRRRTWFQLANSAEEADIVLRIVNYHGSYANKYGFEGPPVELIYVDAVAVAGTAREKLSGLDLRPALLRASLRNAASHLAEELERFAKDNYGALRQLRERANPR